MGDFGNFKDVDIKNVLRYTLQSFEHKHWLDDDYLQYELSARYLLTYKIDHMNRTEARFLITYLTRILWNNLNIGWIPEIQILNHKRYMKTVGDADSLGAYCNGKILFHDNLISSITNYSFDEQDYFRLFKVICHEVAHAKTDFELKSGYPFLSSFHYLISLEQATQFMNTHFCHDHYEQLLCEKSASLLGTKFALYYMEDYVPSIYQNINNTELQDEIQLLKQDISHICSVFSYNPYVVELQNWIQIYGKNWEQVFYEFPILKLGYHYYGEKKEMLECLEERLQLIKEYSISDFEQQINSIYFIILNQKEMNISQIAQELGEIEYYIEHHSKYDPFIHDLFLYRLSLLEKQSFYQYQPTYKTKKYLQKQKKKLITG